MIFVSNMLGIWSDPKRHCTMDDIKDIPHERMTVQEFMEELEHIVENLVYDQGRVTECLHLYYRPQYLGWTIMHHKIENVGMTELVTSIRLDKDDLWLAIEYVKRVVGYKEVKQNEKDSNTI